MRYRQLRTVHETFKFCMRAARRLLRWFGAAMHQLCAPSMTCVASAADSEFCAVGPVITSLHPDSRARQGRYAHHESTHPLLTLVEAGGAVGLGRVCKHFGPWTGSWKNRFAVKAAFPQLRFRPQLRPLHFHVGLGTTTRHLHVTCILVPDWLGFLALKGVAPGALPGLEGRGVCVHAPQSP